MVSPRILLIGGTHEARLIAERLGNETVTSLAGRTSGHFPIVGQVRSGHFGGVDGMADHIVEHGYGAVIDAAHPFAARMHRNTCDAAAKAGVPRITLIRPPWPRHNDDRWIMVSDIDAAILKARSLGNRILLTHGQEVPFDFLPDGKAWYLRTLEKPSRQMTDLTWSKAVLPLNLRREKTMLGELAIDVMVSKLSGGEQTYPKIVAAREASIPVVMIERPPLQLDNVVETVDDAVAWATELLGLST